MAKPDINGSSSSNSSNNRTKRSVTLRTSILLMICTGTVVAAALRTYATSSYSDMYSNLSKFTAELTKSAIRMSLASNETSSSSFSNNNVESSMRSLSPFEQHYLSIYQSMMIRQEIPPKFILWTLDTHGFGNKIRSLNGAMFLAAITDRVLLIHSPSFTHLFLPPILDGVVLDWNQSLATSRGMCNTTDSRPNVQHLDRNPTNAAFAPNFVNFARQYGNVTCLIASASHGHDRQVATLNEETYRDKIERLFGHATSRYNWSRQVLGLLLLRPRIEVRLALQSTMNRLQMDTIPLTNRIGIHIRTFYDQQEKFSWQSTVMNKAPQILDCVGSLVGQRIADIRKRHNSTNTTISVLLVSDSPDLKAQAAQKLNDIPSIRIVDSGLSIVHTGDYKIVTPTAAGDDFDLYIEWLLLGECSMVVGSGYSSFGLTAHFRPAIVPPADFGKPPNKQLYTIDRLVFNRPRYLNMGNKQCGLVLPEGYGDINFGIVDAAYKQKFVTDALNKYGNRSPIVNGEANNVSAKTDGPQRIDIAFGNSIVAAGDKKEGVKGSISLLG